MKLNSADVFDGYMLASPSGYGIRRQRRQFECWWSKEAALKVENAKFRPKPPERGAEAAGLARVQGSGACLGRCLVTFSGAVMKLRGLMRYCSGTRR